MTDRIGNIDFSEVEESPVKRGRGRPPGARNKKGLLKVIDKNYDKIESLLNDTQKAYLKKAFQGLAEFDPLMQMEIFLILYQLYITEVMDKAMNYTTKEGEQTVLFSKDIASTLDGYRMGLKDAEDIRMKREVQKAKTSDNERLVDPTRKSEASFLQELIAGET